MMRENFKCWYSDILDGLYANGDAGFVILMVAFPLLERYLREKIGVHERDVNADPVLAARFYDELRHVFPALRDNTVARHFWHVCRNGLLHQATFSQRTLRGIKMPDVSLTRQVELLTIDPAGKFFWVHPAEFARTIIQTIEADFTTFEGQNSVNHPLPVIYATSPEQSPGDPQTSSACPPTGIP